MGDTILKNTIKRVKNILVSDFARSEHFASLPGAVQKQQIFTHNLIFLCALVIGVAHLIGVNLFNFNLIQNLIPAFNLPINSQAPTEASSLKSLYVVCAMGTIAVAALCAIYFAFKCGRDQKRSDSQKFSLFGNIGSFVHAIIALPIIAALFFIGGYLLSVKFPESTNLSSVPGVNILQILLISKVDALLGVIVMTLVHQLLPFEVHRLRSK